MSEVHKILGIRGESIDMPSLPIMHVINEEIMCDSFLSIYCAMCIYLSIYLSIYIYIQRSSPRGDIRLHVVYNPAKRVSTCTLFANSIAQELLVRYPSPAVPRLLRQLLALQSSTGLQWQ